MFYWPQGMNTGAGIGAKGGEVGPGTGLEVGTGTHVGVGAGAGAHLVVGMVGAGRVSR